MVFKKIPYVYEILPYLNELHIQFGHINYKNLSKKFLDGEFYLDSIDIITEAYTKDCPECYAKFYSKKILNNPKVILEEGPLNRYNIFRYGIFLWKNEI